MTSQKKKNNFNASIKILVVILVADRERNYAANETELSGGKRMCVLIYFTTQGHLEVTGRL